MVYDQMVSEIAKGNLLENPELHFDYDQCCGLSLTSKTGAQGSNIAHDRISKTALGADIKKEISRKLCNS